MYLPISIKCGSVNASIMLKNTSKKKCDKYKNGFFDLHKCIKMILKYQIFIFLIKTHFKRERKYKVDLEHESYVCW